MTVEEIRSSLQNSYVRNPSRAMMIFGLAQAIENNRISPERIQDAARAIQQFARELVEMEKDVRLKD